MPVKTVIVLGLILVGILVGLDIWFACDTREGNTWSEIIRSWARDTPLVPWVCGVLTGHFFHPVDDMEPVLGTLPSIAFLVWITFVVGMVGAVFHRLGNPIPPWLPLLPGAVVGALLWPV